MTDKDAERLYPEGDQDHERVMLAQTIGNALGVRAGMSLSPLIDALKRRDIAFGEAQAEVARLQAELDKADGELEAVCKAWRNDRLRSPTATGESAPDDVERARSVMADVIYEAEQAFKTDKTYTRDGHIQRIGAAALTAARRDAVINFARAILHGDEMHRQWLQDAATAFIAGEPLPSPRSSAARREERELHALDEAVIEAVRDFLCNDVGDQELIYRLYGALAARDAATGERSR